MSGFSVDRRTWGYWVRAESWSAAEAALILCGEVPYEVGEEIWENGEVVGYMSYLDMFGGDDYLSLVKLKFGERVPTKDFFKWAKDMLFPLPSELLAEAAKVQTLTVSPESFLSSRDHPPRISKSDARGSHSARTRYEIICAALRFFKVHTYEDLAGLFAESSGALNISELARHLDDQRHKFPVLRDEKFGTSRQNILVVLTDAMSERPKKAPKLN